MKKMTQTFSLLILAGVSFSAFAVAPPPNLEPLEDVAPPTITNKDEKEPEITVIKKNGETIEEYRINGQLYMMKITPAHGVPYYMHKEDQEGGWVMDGPTQPLIIPKWTIFRF